MLRRLGIRGKILAALVLPVLVLFALAGVVSLQSVDEVRTARAVQAMLDAIADAKSVTDLLQAERDAALVAYRPAPPAEAAPALEEAQAATDVAVQRYRRSVAEVELDALGVLAREAVTRLDQNLKAIDNARSMSVARSVPMRTLLASYSNVIDTTIAFPRNVADSMTDRELAAVLAGQVAVQQLVENYRTEQVLGREVLAGLREPADQATLFELIAETTELHFDTSTQLFDLDDENISLSSALSREQGYDSYDNLRDLVDNGGQFLDLVLPEAFYDAAHGEINLIDALYGEIADKADSRADVVANAALRTAAVTVAGAVSAVVVSVVVALSIAQRIAARVRRLTVAAGEVRDELPRLVEQVAIPGQGPDMSLTQIPVDSQDEVGRLAAAFNEVNSTTIEVAQEQAALRASIAEMFVNVARRDQVLLNRQLSFIDALERAEEDPKTLADLFRLDHLATRMRRNAESLLVLAGIDTGRRLRDALPTSDVIRTASSEIEHYERVQIDLPVDPMMLGHTALPAAHLLAEILENATVFSEPGTPVHVSTGVDEHHVIVTVLDQGLGMTSQELAEANAKIRATSASDVLGAQRLGLFVVGRLAQRLNAQVDVGTGPDGTGTLVTVRFPLVLFVGAEQLPRVAPNTASPDVRHEEFVAPEAVAEVFSGHRPELPASVGDVAPGRIGSAENPAQEVDLTALTDGTTEHGLPRRRAARPDPSRTGGAMRTEEERAAEEQRAQSALPTAPRADAFAGVADLGAEETWTPPVVEEAAPLAVRRPRREESDDVAAPATPASGLPVRTPSAPAGAPSSGLPVRRPSGIAPTATPSGFGAPSAASAADPASPESVQQRTSMFTGFRSRRAELAAAAVHVEGDGDAAATTPADSTSLDGAERLAAAAAFFGRSPAERTEEPVRPEPRPEPQAEVVVPGLVDDDEDMGDPMFAPGAPAAVVEPSHEERAAARPGFYLGRHALPPVDEPEPADLSARGSRGAHVLDEGGTAASAPEPFVVPGLAPDPSAAAPAAEPAAWSPPPAPSAPAAEPAYQPAPQAADEPAATPWGSPSWSRVGDAEPAASGTPVAWPPAAQQPAAEPAPAQPAEQPVAQAPAAPVEPVQPVQQAAATPFPPVGASAAPEPAAKPRKKRRWFGRKQEDVVEQAPAPAASEPEIRTGFGRVDVVGRDWPQPSATPSAPGAGTPAAPAAFQPQTGTFQPQPDAFRPAGEPAEQAAPEPAPTGFRPEPAGFQPEPSGFGRPPADTGFGAVPVPHRPAPAEQTPPAPSGQPQQQAWQPPAVDIPSAAVQPGEGWSPSQAWAPAEPAAPSSPAGAPAGSGLPSRGASGPGVPAAGATFTPEPVGGLFDDEVTNMLAQKADIAQQALAELSQLSSYRPKAVGSASTPLVRRTPGTIPAAPAIERKRPGQRTERDADQVRSLLSSFQSGTSRGRREGADQTGPEGATGPEPGAGTPHGESVTTPEADLTPRSTSW